MIEEAGLAEEPGVAFGECGGTLGVRDAEGGGTVFRVDLVRAALEEAHPGEEAGA